MKEKGKIVKSGGWMDTIHVLDTKCGNRHYGVEVLLF